MCTPWGLQLQSTHASDAPHKWHPVLVPLRTCISCFPATQAQLLIVLTQYLKVHDHFTQPKQGSPVWTFSKASSLAASGQTDIAEA